MQLEHILMAHGLIGRGGKGETQLPEITNFIATPELDGLGISLKWGNSVINEYINTIIFMSATDLNVADYDYCVANTTEILDTSTLEELIVKNITSGTKYYFKAFMKFNTLGEIRVSKGVTTSAIAPHLPSVISFTATSKEDGSGVNLNWINSAMAEYSNTEIFVSINNISDESRDYCLINTTKIIDSNILTSFLYKNVVVGTTYYFKIFMSFNIGGQTKWNDGRSANATVIDIVPPATITNFTATADDGAITLNWTNPTDSDFSKVKILYKQGELGNYPTNPVDGIVGYEGSGNTVKLTGLLNDVPYFVRAFTYDTTGNINSETTNQQLTATPKAYQLYGVKIDTNNSNPETALTYTDMAVGFTPAFCNNGNWQMGSWENKFPFNEIKPCLLKNGVVNYYLNPNDYTQKATGGASDITSGADGDVMVEFPKIYWKFERIGTDLHIRYSDTKVDEDYKCLAHTVGLVEKDKIYLPAYRGFSTGGKLRSLSGKLPTATQTIGQFRTLAQANGAGYQQMAYYPLLMLQVLALVAGKNRDSQTQLGRGYVDGNSAATNTGQTNTNGMYYGETTGKKQNKFCGIEDFYGNQYLFIDGMYSDASRNMMISDQTVFNDNGSGYVNHGVGASANLNGYIGDVQGGTETGFIIKASNGSATTHYSDNGALAGGYLPYFGGRWISGDFAGAFGLRVNIAASSSTANYGGALCFIGS